MAPRTLLTLVISLSVVFEIVGCGNPPTEAPNPGAAQTSSAGSSSCAFTPSFTVLQVGKTPSTDAKKVADNCWWQFPVQDLHGVVGQPLGWQLCNTCDVDVEFRLASLVGDALTGCNTFIDAAGQTTPELVPHGQIDILQCTGMRELQPDQYVAAARLAGSTGLFIESDPELEISDQNGVLTDKIARLAQTADLNQCLVPSITPGRRFRISGRFTRVNASSTIVFVPAGPGPFGATWGGDLVEFASKTGAALKSGDEATEFAVTADVPAFVTDFVIRTSTGLTPALRVALTPACP